MGVAEEGFFLRNKDLAHTHTHTNKMTAHRHLKFQKNRANTGSSKATRLFLMK